jgi:hypothetical protein
VEEGGYEEQLAARRMAEEAMEAADGQRRGRKRALPGALEGERVGSGGYEQEGHGTQDSMVGRPQWALECEGGLRGTSAGGDRDAGQHDQEAQGQFGHVIYRGAGSGRVVWNSVCRHVSGCHTTATAAALL